jgi:5-formyltetrahydrofolate cyclo-ligase
MNPRDAKATLRKAALQRRATVPPEVREAFAAKLAIEGVALARRAIVRTVAAYWPVRGEADTSALVLALDYHEFIAALPAVVAPDAPLVFRGWTSRDPLIPGPFGTMEPSRRLREVLPDILFLPLAAFDRRGYRIGSGAGYYDRTLPALRAMKPVLTVGVGFAVQEVPEVPAEPHDARLDLVMTETELIECGTD